MASHDLIPGSKFRLLRESDTTPGTYEFICIATTTSFERGKEFEDATVPDCDAPDVAPDRRSVVKSRSWDVTFSGRADAARLVKIETDYESDATHKYQILIALTSGAGGRTYTGSAYMGPVTLGKSDNGMVTFSSSLRGDGKLTKASVA